LPISTVIFYKAIETRKQWAIWKV